jgi:hypothetical protein
MKTMAALDRRLRGAASWLGVGERMGSAEPSSGVA